MARVMNNQRPYGAEDGVGLYRLSSVSEKSGQQSFYEPDEDFSRALANQDGQKSALDFFTDTQLEMARKNDPNVTGIKLTGSGFIFTNGS